MTDSTGMRWRGRRDFELSDALRLRYRGDVSPAGGGVGRAQVRTLRRTHATTNPIAWVRTRARVPGSRTQVSDAIPSDATVSMRTNDGMADALASVGRTDGGDRAGIGRRGEGGAVPLSVRLAARRKVGLREGASPSAVVGRQGSPVRRPRVERLSQPRSETKPGTRQTGRFDMSSRSQRTAVQPVAPRSGRHLDQWRQTMRLPSLLSAAMSPMRMSDHVSRSGHGLGAGLSRGRAKAPQWIAAADASLSVMVRQGGSGRTRSSGAGRGSRALAGFGDGQAVVDTLPSIGAGGVQPASRDSGSSTAAASHTTLIGELIVDGRQLGMIVAREQTKQAMLPSARGSGIEVGSMPLYRSNASAF